MTLKIPDEIVFGQTYSAQALYVSFEIEQEEGSAELLRGC